MTRTAAPSVLSDGTALKERAWGLPAPQLILTFIKDLCFSLVCDFLRRYFQSPFLSVGKGTHDPAHEAISPGRVQTGGQRGASFLTRAQTYGDPEFNCVIECHALTYLSPSTGISDWGVKPNKAQQKTCAGDKSVLQVEQRSAVQPSEHKQQTSPPRPKQSTGQRGCPVLGPILSSVWRNKTLLLTSLIRLPQMEFTAHSRHRLHSSWSVLESQFLEEPRLP